MVFASEVELKTVSVKKSTTNCICDVYEVDVYAVVGSSFCNRCFGAGVGEKVANLTGFIFAKNVCYFLFIPVLKSVN